MFYIEAGKGQAVTAIFFSYVYKYLVYFHISYSKLRQAVVVSDDDVYSGLYLAFCAVHVIPCLCFLICMLCSIYIMLELC